MAIKLIIMSALIVMAVGGVLLMAGSVRCRIRRHIAGRLSLSDDEFGKLFVPDQAAIAVSLRRMLGRHLEVDVSRIRPDDKLADDLLLGKEDSMATVELLLDIEDELGAVLDDQQAQSVNTFADLVLAVTANARQKITP